jgi:hypothetical protein
MASTAQEVLAGLGYIAEAGQAVLLLEGMTSKTAASYATLGLQLAAMFDPSVATNAEYQQAQQIMAALTNAEAGQSGVLATIPLSVNNVKETLTISVS